MKGKGGREEGKEGRKEEERKKGNTVGFSTRRTFQGKVTSNSSSNSVLI